MVLVMAVVKTIVTTCISYLKHLVPPQQNTLCGFRKIRNLHVSAVRIILLLYFKSVLYKSYLMNEIYK